MNRSAMARRRAHVKKPAAHASIAGRLREKLRFAGVLGSVAVLAAAAAPAFADTEASGAITSARAEVATGAAANVSTATPSTTTTSRLAPPPSFFADRRARDVGDMLTVVIT